MKVKLLKKVRKRYCILKEVDYFNSGDIVYKYRIRDKCDHRVVVSRRSLPEAIGVLQGMIVGDYIYTSRKRRKAKLKKRRCNNDGVPTEWGNYVL